MYHGQEVRRLAHGSVYEGQDEDGIPHGQGIMRKAKSSSYEGQSVAEGNVPRSGGCHIYTSDAVDGLACGGDAGRCRPQKESKGRQLRGTFGGGRKCTSGRRVVESTKILFMNSIGVV